MPSAFSNYLKYLDDNNYSNILYQYSNPIRGQQYKLPIEVSASYLRPGINAFDWSCGNGHFSTFLLSYDLECYTFSFEAPPPRI